MDLPKNMFADRRARFALYVGAALVIILFMWATAPRPNPPAGRPLTDAAPSEVEGPAEATPVEADRENPPTSQGAPKKSPPPAPKKPAGFTEKRTPHFVSTSIANNATLPAMPTNLTLTFDAKVNQSTESFITVKRDQIVSATQGSSYIGGDGGTLSVNLNPQVQDGEYYVYYVACFADVGCTDGRFGFRLRKP